LLVFMVSPYTRWVSVAQAVRFSSICWHKITLAEVAQLSPGAPIAPGDEAENDGTADASEKEVRLSTLSTNSDGANYGTSHTEPSITEGGAVPPADIMQTMGGEWSASSSMTSSPRRPRRAGTMIPEGRNVSGRDFGGGHSGILLATARDEFEEEFLDRSAPDKEAQIISQVLQGVDFRQLSEDEEVLSDDAADSRRGEGAVERAASQSSAQDSRYDCDFDTIDLRRHRQSTVRTNWRRVPSEVGCSGCEGCERLCSENQRLRRQLDELEFELASGVLHNPPDAFDPAQVAMAASDTPQITGPRKSRGWASRLRHSTGASMSSSKPSERSRLRSEVKALTITTEYLWRKLSKAELELQEYRLKDLRRRMGKAAERNHSGRGTGFGRVEAQSRNHNARSADWEWE